MLFHHLSPHRRATHISSAILLTASTALAAPLVAPAPVSAHAAQMERLGSVIQYRAPKGWKSAKASQPNARVFTAPDNAPNSEAILLLMEGPQFTGDFRPKFEAAVKAALGGRKQIRATEIQTTHSTEGFEVLAQAVVTEDDKGGGQQFGAYVAINANGRLVVTGCVTTTQERFAACQPVLAQFLKDLDLSRAGKATARPRATESVVTPSSAAPVPIPAPGGSAEEVLRSEAARRKPGYVRGRVFDSKGRPFTAASGGTVEVRVFGTTYEGHRTSYNTNVDANGNYELRVPDGLYRVIAEAKMQQNGQEFSLPLDPLDGVPPSSDKDSHPGIVKDFGLRLTGGPGLGQKVARGAGMYVMDGGAFHSLFDALERKYPRGSYVQVLLAPEGGMINGTPTKPTIYDCSLDGMKTGFGIEGIPLARYTAAARLVLPDGTKRTLRVSLNGAAGESEKAESAPVVFKPDNKAGIGGVVIFYLYVFE
jgi:hypothetical protein